MFRQPSQHVPLMSSRRSNAAQPLVNRAKYFDRPAHSTRLADSSAIVALAVTHTPHPEIGEVPGVRYVESLSDRDGEEVKLADDFFLYQKAGSDIAHLLDQNTVTHLLHRSRLALRISILNFAFVAVAAFWFADTILKPYPDSLAVAVVCLWILLPWLVVDLLLVRRFESRLREFPAFSPATGLVHKSTKFNLGRV